MSNIAIQASAGLSSLFFFYIDYVNKHRCPETCEPFLIFSLWLSGGESFHFIRGILSEKVKEFNFQKHGKKIETKL